MKRQDLRWNGWGATSRNADFHGAEQEAFAWIAEVLNLDALPDRPGPDLDDITLPESRLTTNDRDALAGILGADTVKTDKFERAFHAYGQSYHDILRCRREDLEHAPDAVVYPENGDQVVALLSWAKKEKLAVVPYGGGSSVVGGVTARAGEGQRGVITLDTTRLDALLSIDEASMTATLQAGIYGPALEDALQAKGFTLGHYPQSFEYSTLGGWIAARGAGQQSNKYGKAEKWFVSARMATANGIHASEAFPASAAGPRFGDLVVGSEGAFGVIIDATVKIHKLPVTKDYRGWLFKSFEDGSKACRQLVQDGLPMAMIRLSDVDETKFQSQFAKFGKEPGMAETLFKKFIAFKGYSDNPCLMLTGIEGDPIRVAETAARAGRVVKAHNGMALGKMPGQKWYDGRFDSPFLRDPLMDRGVGVDTFETSTNWANILPLYEAVQKDLRAAMGKDGIIMTHISHAYHDGASLYFTYIFPQDAVDPVAQWQAIKTAATDSLVQHGGTISHHHGTGEDHRPWMAAEKGPLAMAALHAVKDATDPDGILNPGKML